MIRCMTLTLLLTLWPWTVRAEDCTDRYGTNLTDSTCEAIWDSLQQAGVGSFDNPIDSSNWPMCCWSRKMRAVGVVDSIVIPQPEPAVTLSDVRRMIDSTVEARVAELGRWRMDITHPQEGCDGLDTLLIYRSHPAPCTTYVWIRREP